MSVATLRFGSWGFVLVTGLLLATAVSVGANRNRHGECAFYNGDAGSTRYAPFDQINKDTVKDLTIAWRWKAENFGPRPETNYKATPLMVDGVLYVTAGTQRDVVAIDAETAKRSGCGATMRALGEKPRHARTTGVCRTGPTAPPSGSSMSHRAST